MITNQIPETWRDLQIKVGAILEQCGFKTEVEKTLTSVRGKVELDIYAEEVIDGRQYSIVCECKYWRSNIPQTVIHGFRTVINDLGCNIGYIITTSDFQIGAVAAVEKTNVELLTWEKFQAIFFKSWYSNHFCRSLIKFTYLDVEYSWVDWFDDLTPEDRSIYNELKNKLGEIDEVKSHFSYPILDKIDLNFIIPKLPLCENLYNGDYYGYFPREVLNETGYEELLWKLKTYSKPLIDDFKKLDKKYSELQQ